MDGGSSRECAGPRVILYWLGVSVTSDLDENLPASVLRHLDGLISAHTARD